MLAGFVPSENCEEEYISCLFPNFWGVLAIWGVPWLTERSIALVPAFIFAWLFSPCVYLCYISHFYKDIGHIGLEVHPTPV